jgi:hypothetical protein
MTCQEKKGPGPFRAGDWLDFPRKKGDRHLFRGDAKKEPVPARKNRACPLSSREKGLGPFFSWKKRKKKEEEKPVGAVFGPTGLRPRLLPIAPSRGLRNAQGTVNLLTLPERERWKKRGATEVK